MRALCTAVFSALLTLVFPEYCCACKRMGRFLCDACTEQIDVLWQPLHLSATTPVLNSVHALSSFTPPVSACVTAFKYQGVRALGSFLATLLYQRLRVPTTEVITCVPLHPKRLRFRGFNQSEELARELANQTQVPYQSLLVRTQYQASQASIRSKADRLSRLSTSFALNPSARTPLPKSVLLIDDVITTGTTLRECASVLSAGGVQEIHGLAIAHKTS